MSKAAMRSRSGREATTLFVQSCQYVRADFVFVLFLCRNPRDKLLKLYESFGLKVFKKLNQHNFPPYLLNERQNLSPG